MIIGIDASRAAPAERTGTELYAYRLIEALIRLTAGTPYRLRLYFNQQPPPRLFPARPHVQPVIIPWPRLWTHLRLAWELQQRPPDVFFTPAHVIPLTYRRPSVATVHDLGYHYFPEAHSRGQRLYLRWSTRHNGRRASRVIADSQATQADLAHFYGIAAAKIQVVYPALPHDLTPVTDSQRLTAVQQKYGITPPYLLTIGTLQPRKNLARLVAAFAALPNSDHQLVLAGKPGWLAAPILTEIANRKSEIGNRLLLPGFISDDDKAALISGATALLYPSLYEGFGFPILEGQACGVPVLGAGNSSQPEVAGDAALLVNALDTAAISRGIQRLISDPELRQELVQKGFANLQRFSWEETARQTLALLAAVARGEAEEQGKAVKSQQPTANSQQPTANSPLAARQVLRATPILGVPVHRLTTDEALAAARRFMAAPRLHQIATVNPEFVMAAQQDAEFRLILQQADLCLADGVGLLWAARRLGRPLPERIPGSEFVYHLAGLAAAEGWRLFLLGAAPGVAEAAAAVLQQQYPNLLIAGTYAGSPNPAEDSDLVRRINASRANLLYVAYGAPRQDKWIARNRRRLPTVRLALGVGGSLDFIAGRAVRAPRWLQNLGLEWLHRLYHEPWRWRRMLALPRFVWAVWRSLRYDQAHE